jgi:hypothetical protein
VRTDPEPERSDTCTSGIVMKNAPFLITNTAMRRLYIREIGDYVAGHLARGKAGRHEL